jgi:hypothetical protein
MWVSLALFFICAVTADNNVKYGTVVVDADKDEKMMGRTPTANR